ncbi:MAG: glycosyltransferase [Eubacterium sp.]
MNILLSSYSCNPYHGSEDGIGWHWAEILSKNFKDSTVYLVTKKANEADTKKGIEEFGLSNVKLIIVDLPYCFNWYREKNSAFHHIYYIAWQNLAYKWAKKSKIKFDIIHHVTMGDFRITGKMYKFKNAHTIFGPVGGGQASPKSLKCYEKSNVIASVRELINKSTSYMPSYKRHIKQFDEVYAINKETEKYLSQSCSCKRLFELAIPDELKNLQIEKKDTDCVNIMYMGRFIEKKGVILLLDIMEKIPKNLDFTLSIYGQGPLKNTMEEIIKEKNLSSRVSILGPVEHSMISSVYANSDIFIMPSIRETSGNVLIEAMAHKAPVVALDMSICSDLKEHSCGLFVDINQSRDKIIKDFVDSLTSLINDRNMRITLGENGYNYVNNELTWENKFKIIYGKYL